MEKSIFDRRQEFLDETIAYFSKDTKRRAVKNIPAVHEWEQPMTSCMYRMTQKNGKVKCCAIGRHISKEGYKPSIEGKSYNKRIEVTLPKEISELGVAFLRDVQQLHDDSDNWNKTQGLSNHGKEQVKNIVSDYCKE